MGTLGKVKTANVCLVNPDVLQNDVNTPEWGFAVIACRRFPGMHSSDGNADISNDISHEYMLPLISGSVTDNAMNF